MALSAAVALPQSASAQLVPADLLDRLASVEQVNTRQSSDLLSATTDLAGLRTGLTTLQTGALDQRRLIDLNAAGLDAVSTDVAALRSTLGTLDVDILSINTRNDAQDVVIADHERRITTNTTNISNNTTAISNHTREIADHRETLTRHDREIADTRERTAIHTVEIADLRNDTEANTNRLDGHDRDISALQRRIGAEMQDMRSALDVQGGRIDRATEGVAMAFALNAPAIASDRTFALSGGFGNFEGRNAFAVSGGVRASDAVQLDAGLAVGLDSGTLGGRAGATISW